MRRACGRSILIAIAACLAVGAAALHGADEAAAGPVAAPSNPAWPSTYVGTDGGTITITFSESASDTTVLSGPPTLSGADAADWTVVSSTCTAGFYLNASFSCSAVLRFSPLGAGTRSASLTLVGTDFATSNAVAVPVALVGQGTALTLSGSIPAFGTRTIGQGASQLATIANVVGGAVRIGQPTIVGAAASSYAVGAVDTCAGQTIGLGGSCTILVEFLPTAVGALGASLSVPSADLAAPLTIALDGIGQAAIAPTPPPAARVTFCHRVGGPDWVVLTTAPEVVVNAGHPNHPLDIIPPFSYLKSGRTITFAGQNWDAAGQAILANGCVEAAQRTAPPPPPPAPNEKVTLCHRVGGPTWNEITVAPQGAYNGHASHHGQDIIPPFSFRQGNRTISFQGQNWDREGQAILANGCRAPEIAEPAVPAQQVTICHREGGPFYVRLSIAPQAAINGHEDHALDIIPPFSYRAGNRDVSFPGRNWNAAGRATWNAGCVDPTPPAEPITPTLQCIDLAADGSFTAHFGYRNPGSSAVAIAIGASNQISGGTASGQPASFQPGAVERAVSVSGVAAGGTARWSLAHAGAVNAVEATAQSTRCAIPQTAEIGLGLVAACVVRGDGTYTAVFGYQNDSTVQLRIPAGDDNAVVISSDPTGPRDRGQTTAFDPGARASAFSIAGIPRSASVSWTVVIGGVPRSAVLAAGDERCASDAPTPTPKDERELERIGVYVSCVRANGNGTYDAVFGYMNPNLAAVEVPAGTANAVAASPNGPGDADRGQTTSFLPGTFAEAWTATWIPAGQELTWTVALGGTATATAGPTSPACETREPEVPPKPEPPDLLPAEAAIGIFAECARRVGGSYSVTFGYVSAAAVPTTIPVGADNRFIPGRWSRGQPEVFLPGRQGSAFTVSGIPLADRLTWRLQSPDGTVATATAGPGTPDCATEPRITEPEPIPEPKPPEKPIIEGKPTPIIVDVRNPDPDPVTDVITIVPTGPGYTIIKARGKGCSTRRGRLLMRTDLLLPGTTARCRLVVRISSCEAAVIGALATGRLANGAISARTGGTLDLRSCRRSTPQPVTG